MAGEVAVSASADIVEIIAGLSRSFMRIGLRPPTTIVLASREEGLRLLGEIQQLVPFTYRAGGDNAHARPVLGPNDEPFMECEVMGMKVQWPAVKMILPGGNGVWT